MQHQSLRQLLLAYNPKFDEEIVSKKLMLDFLDNHPDCFERSCKPGHFTASAWILSHDLQAALLMHHKKLNKWLQLGGHCDGDSDLLRVALKEAQEESGLSNIELVNTEIFDIDVHEIPAYKNEPVHLHFDVRFIFRAVGDSKIIKNSESLDLRWFGPDIKSFPTTEISVLRMFNKWLKYYPKDSLLEHF